MFDALIINVGDSCSFLYKPLSEFMLCTKASPIFAFGDLPSASSYLLSQKWTVLTASFYIWLQLALKF